MRKTVLIGIHGLGNKPPRPVLADWWLRSVKEAFVLFGHKPPRFRFEMVYWADLLHEHPLDPTAPPGHPLYADHRYAPYTEPPQVRRPSRLRKAILDELEKLLDRVAFSDSRLLNLDRIGDRIIQALFRDLEIYYYGTCVDRKGRVRPARDVIREELASTLRRHQRDRTVLLAHSMGTIVAHDVLANPAYGVEVDVLLTMGSPLGLPPIIHKHQAELAAVGAAASGLQRPAKSGGHVPSCPSPEGIRERWLNVSDLEDHVALNYDLADDYAPNSRGVAPEDIVVYNTCWEDGERDPHSIFGYIRTPEVAAELARLLAAAPPRVGLLGRLAALLGRPAR